MKNNKQSFVKQFYIIDHYRIIKRLYPGRRNFDHIATQTKKCDQSQTEVTYKFINR